MAVFKCKMCGGTLEINNETVATCEYCGTQQTFPKSNQELVHNLFNRANALRLKCEFDKAEQIYEKILQEDNTESEAHWGIVLCKYGIEYVEDPKTYKRIPTCHRTSYDAVTADAEYLAALEYADEIQKSIYEAEAKAIDDIQRNILNIVKNEKPFDVFICYKETDEDGKRTMDSAIANDIYYQLTQEGLKVFYAAITLEDKLGQEYEPYIFAALNSAKVMLVIGTKPQYFSAVWVKNEWSRFLKLMKTNRSKLLIPCYKDMDAYELPEEFSHLQAQDMAKIGFINDVVRGIKKVTAVEAPKAAVVKETVVAAANTNIAPLLKRAFMFLEDGDWNSANEYCEKVLDMDPECAQAYLGKLMVELQVKTQENLKNCAVSFAGNSNYQKAVRFGDDALKATLTGYIVHITTRNENARLEKLYIDAKKKFNKATAPKDFTSVANLFCQIPGYKDADELAAKCTEQAEELRQAQIYAHGQFLMKQEQFEQATATFSTISGYKDANELVTKCQEQRREAIYNRAYQKYKNARCDADCVFAAEEFKKIPGYKDADELVKSSLALREALHNEGLYNNANRLMDNAKTPKAYKKAIEEFQKIPDYKDVAAKITYCQHQCTNLEVKSVRKKEKCKKITKIVAIILVISIVVGLLSDLTINIFIPGYKYNQAMDLMEAENYQEAISAFGKLDGYKDSATKITECETAILDEKYAAAVALMNGKQYTEAVAAFAALNGYKDSADKIKACKEIILDFPGKYDTAVALMNGKNYAEAITTFATLDGYKDSTAKIQECEAIILELDKAYNGALSLMNEKKYDEAIAAFAALDGYKDSATKIKECAYRQAKGFADEKQFMKAIALYMKVGDYADAKEQANKLREKIAVQETVSAGSFHTVGLLANGNVYAAGGGGDMDAGQCDVWGWTDVVAISAGNYHTVGLKADGTVVAVGANFWGQCNVSDWKDIVAISAGWDHTVGRKADGTVVAVGYNSVGQCDVSDWKDIVAIGAGESYTVGLKADGTVVVVGYTSYGEYKVSYWKDIVAISAGVSHTIGLKADGTVVAVGNNGDGQCNVSDWKDIVAISAGISHTIGLKADGTVVAVGYNGNGMCNVGDWQNIVAISAGFYHTVGLKADGTVVAVGNNSDGQCNVSDWTNIKVN